MVVRSVFTAICLLAVFENSSAIECYNCSTSENFDCQANPTNLNKEAYTCNGKFCLTSNIANGNIRRWCVDNFPSDFNTDTGTVCNSPSHCNTIPYSFDCVSCDSTVNPNCRSNVSLVTDTCLSPACYSSVDSTGTVVRGCVDCSSHPSTCSSCNNDIKCNIDNYQSCYQCKGTDCVEISSATNITQCPANNICYTKLNSDGLLERDCSTKEVQCEGTTCQTCYGDNCNRDVLPANRLSCLQCNGTEDCNKGLTIGKYCSKYVENDECFTYADGDNLIRGCLSDDIQKNCTTSNCEKCNSTNCNTLKLNERPSKLKCYQCVEDCHLTEELEASPCKMYPFNAEEKCYTFGNNTSKSVERGCFYDVADIEARCANGSSCATCTGDSCNNKSVVSCYECTDCLNTTENTTLTQCTAGAFCLSKIDESNKVMRTCSDKECTDGHCEICGNDKCNSGVFPKNRQACLQCSSLSADDDCSKGVNTNLELCRAYKKDDKCYLYSDVSDNKIHRGCSVDLDDQQTNCNSENHCEECDGYGCNKRPLFQKPERTCVKCVNCTNELPEEETCSSSHLYYVKEECYTQNITQNNITTTNRGCLNDLPSQESCGDNCIRCETDGCNKHGDDYIEFPEFRCVVCNSEGDDQDCSKSEPKHCRPIPTSLNRGVGCFVERRGDLVIRDCLSNADNWNTTLTSKNVLTCTTDSCNTMAAPGSAVSIQLSSGLIIALLATIILIK